MAFNKRKCLLVIARYICEDIDNYGQLAKILYDYQAPEDTIKGRFSITTGTNEEFSAVGVAAAALLNTRSVNRGKATGALAAATTTFPFSINLISLVGSLAGEKYLPLWEMTLNGGQKVYPKDTLVVC